MAKGKKPRKDYIDEANSESEAWDKAFKFAAFLKKLGQHTNLGVGVDKPTKTVGVWRIFVEKWTNGGNGDKK